MIDLDKPIINVGKSDASMGLLDLRLIMIIPLQ